MYIVYSTSSNHSLVGLEVQLEDVLIIDVSRWTSRFFCLQSAVIKKPRKVMTQYNLTIHFFCFLFVAFLFFSFLFVSFRFVLLRFASLRFFSLTSVRLASFRFISFRFVSFRFVSFLRP